MGDPTTPPASSRAPAARAPLPPSRRPPRRRWPLILLMAIGTLAIGTAVVFIAVGEEGEPVEITGVAQTRELLAGIAEHEGELGNPDAAVTVTLFNDLQCTDCAEYQLEIVPSLVRDLVREDVARLDLRHFPLAREGQPGLTAYGAVAASEQAAEWSFAHLALLNLETTGPRGADEEFLRAVAAGTGIDVAEWEEALRSPEVDESIETDLELAADLRLPAEPTAVVDGPGGTRELAGSPAVAQIEEAVEAVR